MRGATAPDRRAGHRALTPVVVAAVVGVVLSGWATRAVTEAEWFQGTTNRIAGGLLLLTVYGLFVSAALLYGLRAPGRTAQVTFALAGAFGLWSVLTVESPVWTLFPLLAVRFLVYWLVLAWPTGRLSGPDRRLLAGFALLGVALGWVVPYLFQPEILGRENPLARADVPALADVAGSVSVQLVLPVLAVVVGVILARRYAGLPPVARRTGAYGLAAGLAFGVADVTTLYGSRHLGSLLFADGSWTPFGLAYIAIDYLHYLVVPAVLVAGAAHLRRRTGPAERVRRLELGAAQSAVQLEETVADVLGEKGGRVLFRDDRGHWSDGRGHPADLRTDAARTLIRRGADVIAAIEHPADAEPPLPSLEAAVVAARFTIDSQRLEAVARARREQADRARQALAAAVDDERRRTQRDLHDGAQQRLVGLALHVRLAQHGDDPAPEALADLLTEEVESSRRELLELVSGHSVLLGDRSLDEAIGELGATVPLPVDIRFEVPSSLADGTRSAAWFVVAEATTNAVKYSGASRLRITGEIVDGELRVEVADDGRGGATDRPGGGLAGLRERVERIGGSLSVESEQGAGTRLRAAIPAIPVGAVG